MLMFLDDKEMKMIPYELEEDEMIEYD